MWQLLLIFTYRKLTFWLPISVNILIQFFVVQSNPYLASSLLLCKYIASYYAGSMTTSIQLKELKPFPNWNSELVLCASDLMRLENVCFCTPRCPQLLPHKKYTIPAALTQPAEPATSPCLFSLQTCLFR